MTIQKLVQILTATANPDFSLVEADVGQLDIETRLTELLFSCKINPQTLLFLGYSDNRFGWMGMDLRQNDRTFFIKVSYAWRM